MNKKATKNQKTQEIITGIKDLDSLFTGLEQNSIIVIGGHSVDSSAFLFNLVANLCIYKKKCLYCTPNFWEKQLLRVLTNIEFYMNDNYKTILNGNFKDYVNLELKSLTDISQWDIHTFDTSIIELPLMEEKIKKLSPDYVFIDTIRELEASSCKEYIPQFIEEMAKKYNVCFFINTFEKNPTSCIEFEISDMEVSTNLIELANEIVIASSERCNGQISIKSAKRLNKFITIPYSTKVLY